MSEKTEDPIVAAKRQGAEAGVRMFRRTRPDLYPNETKAKPADAGEKEPSTRLLQADDDDNVEKLLEKGFANLKTADRKAR